MTMTRILAAAGIASMALGGAALAQTNVSTQGGVEAAKDQMVRDAAAMEDEMKKNLAFLEMVSRTLKLSRKI